MQRVICLNISQADSAVCILSSICGICFDQNHETDKSSFVVVFLAHVLKHLPFKTFFFDPHSELCLYKTLLFK